MSAAVANFLFEAANLVLLTAGLAWVFFTPVRRALDEEEARHAKTDEDLARARAEAETLRREAQAARAAAERDGASRRAELLAAAERDAAAGLERSRNERSAERRALEEELRASREAQVAARVDDLARIAAASVERLLAAVGGPSLDLALARLACDKLRALPDDARRRALVESARELDPPTRELLAGVLGESFGVRIVGELAAGLRVITPAGQVDVSARSFAREAAEALRRAAGGSRGAADG